MWSVDKRSFHLVSEHFASQLSSRCQEQVQSCQGCCLSTAPTNLANLVTTSLLIHAPLRVYYGSTIQFKSIQLYFTLYSYMWNNEFQWLGPSLLTCGWNLHLLVSLRLLVHPGTFTSPSVCLGGVLELGSESWGTYPLLMSGNWPHPLRVVAQVAGAFTYSIWGGFNSLRVWGLYTYHIHVMVGPHDLLWWVGHLSQTDVHY